MTTTKRPGSAQPLNHSAPSHTGSERTIAELSPAERAEWCARIEPYATALIREYLDASWSFRFDHARMRAGSCNYTRRQISLSRYVAPLMSAEEIQQTLLHEIAHALAGARSAHGPKWQRIAAEIGYVGGRTYDGPVPQSHRWRGRCPAGHEILRHRRPSKPVSCSKCSRTFDRRHLITWIDQRTESSSL